MGYLISAFLLISLFVTESTCVLFSTLSDPFSLTSQPCPSLLHCCPHWDNTETTPEMATSLGSLKAHLHILTLLWFWGECCINLQQRNWRKKKCIRAALTQITHFKLRPEVSKPPNYPKSLCLKPRGYLFMYCRIRPPLYLTLWVMLSKKVGLFNKE